LSTTGQGPVPAGIIASAEHAVLRSLGVDGGQGWLFGRPAPADVLVGTGTVLAPAPLTT
jgi:EAL domain-containing protein (putative c-di-GMP-specific phosphodiesterase class I)